MPLQAEKRVERRRTPKKGEELGKTAEAKGDEEVKVVLNFEEPSYMTLPRYLQRLAPPDPASPAITTTRIH